MSNTVTITISREDAEKVRIFMNVLPYDFGVALLAALEEKK
jgi:hypothetical protein